MSRTVTTRRGEAERLVAMAADRAKRIGKRIRERRDDLGMTQAQLAEALPEHSITSTYVSRWERGEHEPLGDRLDLIAVALETTPEDLMAGPLTDRKAKGQTPDLGATMDVVSQNNRSQLDRIEQQVADNKDTLAGLVEVVSQLHLVLEKLELEGDTQQQTDATGRKRRPK